MTQTSEMVPVRCGFCRREKATALVRINDNPVFACESCTSRIEQAARSAGNPAGTGRE